MSLKFNDLQAEIFKALGNPMRLEILDVLGKSEMCFSEILEVVGGNKSTLSQHLSILVDKGILNSRKDSRCNYFKLSSPKVVKACQLMREILIENMKERSDVILGRL